MANVVFVMTLFSSQANAVETGNLLSDNFADGSWSGSNLSSRHGDNIIAGVDNQYVESQITLSDHLITPEINTGFTTTLDSEVWFWNNTPNQSVSSTLKIVSDDNKVTEQTVTTSGSCATWNSCSYGSMGSNTIIIGNNDSLDYTITSTFYFSAPNTTGHYAADLKNPSLNITYEEYVLNLDTSTFTDIDVSLGFDTFVMEEQFDFTMDEPVQDMSVTYEIDEIFFYENQSSLDTEVTYEGIPMESYEDEIPDEQFDEPSAFLEEPIQEESFDEEQQFVEEEIFFDEEQDIMLEENNEVIEVAEQDVKEVNEVEVVATFEDVIVAQVDTINVMIDTQPVLIDRENFYIIEDIYTSQVNITDPRELYQNVVFNVFDPVVDYNNRVESNKRRRQQLMEQIRELNGTIKK
jgi:hypothetical protein